jgi:hypothetical protein
VPVADRTLDPRLVEDGVFQRAYPVEVGLLAGLDVPQLAIPERYTVDGDGRIVTTVQRAVAGPALAEVLGSRPRGLGAETTAGLERAVHRPLRPRG